jgi:integrase
VAGIRQFWLKDSILAFLTNYIPLGFKRNSLLDFARRLRGFGEFVEGRGVTQPTQLIEHIEPFVRPMRNTRQQRTWRSFLRRFADFMMPQPLMPNQQTVEPPDARTQLVEEYIAFLLEHRGLKRKTIARARSTCMTFLSFITGDDLTSLRPGCVHRFIVAQSQGYSRSNLRSQCCTIRGFLDHLYRRGAIGSDLSGAVIVPREYKQEQCPRFLTRAEVEAVLAAIDRRTASGKRAYAMLMLLANYGLRGGEVCTLRLSDIDWRNNRIRIARRKAGNSTDYPLTAAVGEAILDYLRFGRPYSPHREVFLTAIAPVRPMRSTSPIAYQVAQHRYRGPIQTP